MDQTYLSLVEKVKKFRQKLQVTQYFLKFCPICNLLTISTILTTEFFSLFVVLYRYLFVKKKVFSYSELHFSEVTSYKIHTLKVGPIFDLEFWNDRKTKNIFMVIFIVLRSCLFTTKLSCLQKITLGTLLLVAHSTKQQFPKLIH